MDGLTELEVKLTYSDGVKKISDLSFYFEDAGNMEDLNLIERLIQIDFRDTYLDQPFIYHAKLLTCLLYSTLQSNVQITDPFLTISKDHFNISVAKLKKTFSFHYLLDVLAKEDTFVTFNDLAHDHNGSDLVNEKHLRSQGFSFLKPYIADFIKIVHIFSDTSSSETLYSELTFT